MSSVTDVKQIRNVLRPEAGVALAMAAWIPDRPKAVALISHGHAEHLGRYGHVVNALVQRGYAVYGQDHRGHGRSSGTRALVMRFDDVVDDFRRLAKRAKQEHPNLPVVLIGHSMGGLIAIRYTLRYGDELSALVSSGPALMLAEEVSPITRVAGHVLGHIVPTWPVRRSDEDRLSTDPDVRRQFGLDHRCYNGPTRTRTALEIIHGGEDACKRLEQITLPLLAMHGANDTITAPKGTRLLHGRAGSTDKTLVVWPGLRHEIFNEPNRREIITLMLDWLDARVPLRS